MAVKYTRDGDQNWKAEVVLVGAGTSDPILIPGWVEELSVAVFPNATATVYYTLDPENDVDAAPGSADWIAWEAGAVTAATGYPANSAVTAVRVITTGGGATLKVAGKRKTVRIR